MGSTMFTFQCRKCDHKFTDFQDRDRIRKIRLDCPECNAVRQARRIYTSNQIIDDTFKEPLHMSTLKACSEAAVKAGAPYDICHSRSEVRRCMDQHAQRYGVEVCQPDGT